MPKTISQSIAPSRAVVGRGIVGFDAIPDSGIEPDEIRATIAEHEALPKLSVKSSQQILAVEPDRTVYQLDTEPGNATGELVAITGGVDGQRIILTQTDPTRVLTLTDNYDTEADDAFLIPGGDFVLRDGDVLVVEFNVTLKRWIEVGRIWTSRTFVAGAAPASSHTHVEQDITNLVHADTDAIHNAEFHIPLVADGSAVAIGNFEVVTADVTLTTVHTTVFCDASAGPIVVTIPAASGNARRLYSIVKIDPTANTVTMDGGFDAVLTCQDEAVPILSNGTNWRIPF